MKKLLCIISLVLTILSINVNASNGINYQAVVRDTKGIVIFDKDVSFRISILQGSVTGKSVYSETHSAKTNSFGLVNLIIGNGSSYDNFDLIDWSNGMYFVLVELDSDNGTNYEVMGTTQLLSVPFAKYAEKSGNGFSGNYNDLTNKPNFITKTEIMALLDSLINEKNNNLKDSLYTELSASIPSKISDLNNDMAFVSESQIPSKISDLDNDMNFVSESQMSDSIDNISLNTIVLSSPTGKRFNIAVSDSGNVVVSELIYDAEGNVYNTIKIGDQTWMKENLKTILYNNGDTITQFEVQVYDLDIYEQWDEVLNANDWINLTTGATTTLPDTQSYLNNYGRLYNWNAIIDSRNICPVGWHVPTYSDWETLINSVNDNVYKLKEIGTTHWFQNDTTTTNESGFSALPAGRFPILNNNLSVQYLKSGSWWSSTEVDSEKAWGYSIIYNQENVSVWEDGKEQGYSVRCIKD